MKTRHTHHPCRTRLITAVLAALGQPDEAIRLFERARTLTGADDYPIDHHLGDTLLAKGDKAQAKAVYERSIANKRAKSANVEEVRKSLAKLAGTASLNPMPRSLR